MRGNARGLALAALIILSVEVSMSSCASHPQPAATEAVTKASPRQIPSPKQIRDQGNGLKNESSLYLRQHAHNPVDWRPWGEEALRLAKEENKPIFLSIGYSSCHWCHVMEKEVFEDDGIAEVLNRHFISIKVDREERPDLDTVYMNAVVALTGSGGWPMSVFLTSSLKPFFGGTYFPPQQFMLLLMEVQRSWARAPGRAAKQAEQISEHVSRHLAAHSQADHPLTVETLDALWRRALERVDPVHGGFKGRMKFPLAVTWRWMLAAWEQDGDEGLEHAIRRSLDAMAGGGLQDQLAGGFHRYTVDERWTVPHFEKMLYDNAQLASLYLQGSAAFQHQAYAETARRTLDFLLKEMRGDHGAFYASFDADSPGGEGSFYVWSPAEITAVAGEEDGPLLADVLGASLSGNFEGKNVLTQRADLDALAKKHDRSRDALRGLLDTHRAALLMERAKRPAPGLDKKVITSWNGLVISALAQGAMHLEEPRYLQAAQRAADMLLDKHRREDGGLYRVSNEGPAQVKAVLDDYAFFAEGLIDLFQAGGGWKYLKAARELTDFAAAHFRHEDGTYFLTEDVVEAPLGRPIDLRDGVRPSGNAAILSAEERLAALAGDQDALQRVKTTLDGRSELLKRAGLEMGAWLHLGLRLLKPRFEVVVAGAADAPATRSLLAPLRKGLPDHVILARVPPEGADENALRLLPALADKKAIDGKPTAYVCTMGACKKPTHDPAELLEQIKP